MSQFEFYTTENSPDEAQALLLEAEKSFGFVPNMYGYMAEAPVTIEAYEAVNKLLNKTAYSPAQVQVALLSASVENECGFCTVAHRAIGKMSKANQQTLDALGNNLEIEDASDKALSHFIRMLVKKRGCISEEELASFFKSGFSKRQALEAVLIVSIKMLSNYINHLTHPEPNPELTAML